MAKFVHLHNHTDFSLQDAAQSVKGMLNRVKALGMDSIAVTEHGNLFSMIPFYKQAREMGIKPIIGCEVYVAVNDHKEKKQVASASGKKWGYHHLVLLAKNKTGYNNLLKLVSISYIDGFYYKPRIDKSLLRKYGEGLIASTACLAGEVTQYAAQGDYDNAKKSALEYAEIFPDRFYLELQNHQIPEETSARETLIKLSKDTGLPLLATNDCHYSVEEHWEAHDVMFCLGTGKDRDDVNRRRYEPKQFYIKSAEEMSELFKDTPEAIENSLKIAEQCNVEIPMGELYLPQFPIPSDFTSQNPDEYLRHICLKGLKSRYDKITVEITERLDFELYVIKKMGFAGYFLITQDFVKYAKDNKIPVGPGRGSAAGSIVAYSAGITNVDPIKYNLLFERFLNPERVTMPDIDIDFCVEGREKVIDYIKEQYGHDSVAQIITFGTMKAKSVLRDVGRVLGLSYGEVDRIAKLVPNELKITLGKAEKMNADLAKVSKLDDVHKELMEYSKVLEGMHRHCSTHAAGVVITPGPMTDYVPLFKNASTGDITTQVEMNSLEDMGLLKMDFLGLRNLTVINKTIGLIKQNHNIEIDIDEIDINVPEVYQQFADGKTIGVFQFESSGMREYLKQLKPTCLEDLIAMNALYRPGPMANIPEFIARKHGKSKISYLHESLETILKETNGIIVYQEQVMQISQTVGRFTLAQGDMMRRAMGKKKADLMAAFKIDFVKGAEGIGIETKVATKIFDLLEKFAQYGFNKSHSTAYALVAYQTAWLKYHYPAEFMAANISSEVNDTNRVVTLISAAKEMGIEVLPPNVNSSYSEFIAIDKKTIAYGLSAIKNVGHKACELISEDRDNNGTFKTIFDLCKIAPQSINRKVLESLIQVGACEDLEGHRAQQLLAIDDAIKYGQKYQEEKESNQASLFGGSSDSSLSAPDLEEAAPWSKEEELNREKALLGFYLSGNPLEDFIDDLKEFDNVNPLDLSSGLPKEIRFGGIVSDVKVRFDKKNRPWAIMEMNGLMGKAKVFVFSESYEKNKDLLIEDQKIFVCGKPSNQNGDADVLKLVADDIFQLETTRGRLSRNVNIQFDIHNEDEKLLNEINSIAVDNKGRCSLVIHLLSTQGNAKRVKAGNIRIAPDVQVVNKLRNIFGDTNVWVS